MMLTRRSFLSLAGAVASATLVLPGCGESRGSTQSSSSSSTSASLGESATSAASTASSAPAASSASAASTSSAGQVEPASSASAEASSAGASESLVLYYSRAGENYEVGYVEEGNTAIVAKMVAENTGAELFEIVPEKAYPEGYDDCCDVALAEQHEGARPAYANDIDLSSYKTIYLGYPIWWGDLPMCLYTFLEAHDWTGIEIHPFCTNGGSGLSGTESSIQSTCAGATVAQGLSILGTTAQNSRDEARSAVEAWLG